MLLVTTLQLISETSFLLLKLSYLLAESLHNWPEQKLVIPQRCIHLIQGILIDIRKIFWLRRTLKFILILVININVFSNILGSRCHFGMTLRDCPVSMNIDLTSDLATYNALGVHQDRFLQWVASILVFLQVWWVQVFAIFWIMDFFNLF